MPDLIRHPGTLQKTGLLLEFSPYLIWGRKKGASCKGALRGLGQAHLAWPYEKGRNHGQVEKCTGESIANRW